MYRLRRILGTCMVSALLAMSAHAGEKTSAEAQAIIDELGLRAASTPMSKQPGWKPEKVAVMLIPFLGASGEEFKASLQRAAGDVELIWIGPGGEKLSEELLAPVDAVIGVCTQALLAQAGDRLRWVHNYFVGMDLCKGYTEQQLDSVVFTNTKRLSGPAIAEHTIAMLMALTRNLPAYHRAQAQSKFQRATEGGIDIGELKGKTLLVVGLGGIGTEIAWRAHGLGMRVIATRRSSREGPDYVARVGLPDELHALAGEADVIANALPLTPETSGVFDKAFFAAAKPGAVFLSVGRGKSTVTDDLVAALESGQLSGAGLDVMDPEPLPASSPLWQMPNVIITPHVAASSPETRRRGIVIAIENLRRYAAGEPLLNVVDLRLGY